MLEDKKGTKKDCRVKVYVDVISKSSKEGLVLPMSIIWEDDTVYEIDRIKYICKAASTKVGGCGIRYTILILGKETYLFREEDRWFVEATC